MKINIETIPHKNQRYPTVGDYWIEKNGDIQIRVSDIGNRYYEYLVASHELRELILCIKRGIAFDKIDKFDTQYEKDRERGKYTLDQEPGNDPDAPYKKEHQYATAIEMIDAQMLDVDWAEYNNKVMSL